MAEKLIAVGIETDLAMQLAVEKAAVLVQASAKDAIGTYNFGWPELAESTLAHKAADTPLYETGKLKESIGIAMGHHRAWVGSNEDTAVWQELGTDKIPPRSFIRLGAIEAEDAIHEITVKTVGSAFAGHRVSLGGIEVLHAIKEGVEYVNRKIDESNEENRK